MDLQAQVVSIILAVVEPWTPQLEGPRRQPPGLEEMVAACPLLDCSPRRGLGVNPGGGFSVPTLGEFGFPLTPRRSCLRVFTDARQLGRRLPTPCMRGTALLNRVGVGAACCARSRGKRAESWTRRPGNGRANTSWSPAQCARNWATNSVRERAAIAAGVRPVRKTAKAPGWSRSAQTRRNSGKSP